MSRIIEPFKQFFDGDGDPLIDGWLKFTESGTNLTDKDTFADVNLEIANTNPLQLDSEGRCPNVFGEGSYRITLYQDSGAGSPGIQIDQKDPVSGAATANIVFPFWSSAVEYGINTIVIYDDDYYISRVDGNKGNIPSTIKEAWEQIEFNRIYNLDIEYSLNDWVIDPSDGEYYKSIVASNQGNTPSSSPTEWRGGLVLLSKNNLNDIGDAATSRTNLDVYSKAETNNLSFVPIGSLIEHYGRNPDSNLYAEASTFVDSSVFTEIKPVINPNLAMTTRTPGGGFGGAFNGGATDGNIFVIVGDTGGEIQTSPDGTTWTQRTAAGSYTGTFNGCAFGNTLFVAVGTVGEIQTSPDGTTWTQRTAAGSYTGTFFSVHYGDSLFIALGGTGEIQTSPDGITWTQRTAAGSYTSNFLTGTYGNSLHVIGGNTGEIQTSPDGVTWTQRTPGSGYGNDIRALAYGNNTFIFLGVSEEIQTSPDGITWTQQNTGGSFNYNGITYGDGFFATCGSATGAFQTTVDGINIINQVTIVSILNANIIKDQTLVHVGASASIQSGDTTNRLLPSFLTSQTGFTQYMRIA